jgi:ATP-dependent RNA helicase DHX36
MKGAIDDELEEQIKSLNLGMIAPFMEKAIDAPPALSVQNAISLLVAIGGLTDDGCEDLTPLGACMGSHNFTQRLTRVEYHVSHRRLLRQADAERAL